MNCSEKWQSMLSNHNLCCGNADDKTHEALQLQGFLTLQFRLSYASFIHSGNLHILELKIPSFSLSSEVLFCLYYINIKEDTILSKIQIKNTKTHLL